MDAKTQEPGDKVTAEQVKELVRRFADQEFPGWECASLPIRVGKLGDGLEEVLLILPKPTRRES